jgi:hypothetical protein
MNNSEINKKKRRLYILSMVNTGIWAISLIALAFILQGNGNIKGMYVILAGGTVVSIQIISSISKLK